MVGFTQAATGRCRIDEQFRVALSCWTADDVRSTLFEFYLVGYFFGLVAAFAGNTLPQPALIYLVPGVLLPLVAGREAQNYLTRVEERR